MWYNPAMNNTRSLWSGAALLVAIATAIIIPSPTHAVPAVPTDIFGVALRDGDLISANQIAGDPDIFIIAIKPFTGYAHPNELYGEYNGFKRLFLNPAIFNMYGHLGGFSSVRQVSAEVRDSFVTSGMFRNCEVNDQRVWATETTGEDTGILHHVQMTGEQASAEDAHFFDKVFCINSREDAFYARSQTAYSRIADIPRYFRAQTCAYEGQAAYGKPCCSGMTADQSNLCRRFTPGPTWTPTPACIGEGQPLGYGTPGGAAQTCCPGLIVADGGRPGISNDPYCVRPGCYYQQVQCITSPCNPVLVCPATATATSVNVTLDTGMANYYRAAISGYTPTSCYTTPTGIAAQQGNIFAITLSSNPTTGGMCTQALAPFSLTVPLNTGVLAPGTYSVIVNQTLSTTFIAQ